MGENVAMNSQRRPLLIAAGIAAIMLIGISLLWQSSSLRLVKTDPKDGGQTNQFTSISFTFNRPMMASKGDTNQITLDPSSPGQTTVSGNTITFTPNLTLQTTKQYTATLANVTDQQGKKIGNTHISFTPIYTDPDSLPADVKKRLAAKTDSLKQTDPFLGSLPYDSLDFHMEIVPIDGQPEVGVTLFGIVTGPHTLAENLAKYKQQQQAALDYITSLKADPAKYTIIFTPNPNTGDADLTIPATKPSSSPSADGPSD